LTYFKGKTISPAKGSIYGTCPALKSATMADGTRHNFYIQDPPNLGRIKSVDGVTVLATYDDSGTTCAFMARYGLGGYALISAHPEADPSWGAGLGDTRGYAGGGYVVERLMSLKQ
jgi:hypothetical protein